MLLTYVPDYAYLVKHKFDGSRNKINKIDPDYNGYIEYSDLTGKKIFAVVFKDGKAVRKYPLAPSSKSKTTRNGMTVSATYCITITIDWYVQECLTGGDPPKEECGPMEYLYTEESEQCYDIPDDLPENEDPSDPMYYQDECLNPDFFYIYGCDGYGTDPGMVTTITPSQYPKLAAIMKPSTTLTEAQKIKIEALLNQMTQDCMGSALYNKVLNSGNKYHFSANPNMTAEASYDASNGNITLKNPDQTASSALAEELMHAMQDFLTPGGIAQYVTSNATGRANIEFETKVLRDINAMINGQGGILACPSSGYTQWLADMTNGFNTFPPSYFPNVSSGYFIFIDEFIQTNPGYSSASVNTSLQPSMMFSIINSSNCPQ